jgi:hypothetical protein
VLAVATMPIEKKRNLLVPLNNPRPPTLWAQIVIAILRPPLLVLSFVFRNLYKLCFGWLDRRMARQSEPKISIHIWRSCSRSTEQRSFRTKEFLSRPASMGLTSQLPSGICA